MLVYEKAHLVTFYNVTPIWVYIGRKVYFTHDFRWRLLLPIVAWGPGTKGILKQRIVQELEIESERDTGRAETGTD
jgi:hypothetical protein